MKKFNEYINESIRDQMKPKSEEEIIDNLSDKEKVIYGKLKELKEYIESKSHLEARIGHTNGPVGTDLLTCSVEFRYNHAFVSYHKSGKYLVDIEDLLNHNAVEEALDNIEEVFEFIFGQLQSDLSGGLDDTNSKIKELEESKKIYEDALVGFKMK